MGMEQLNQLVEATTKALNYAVIDTLETLTFTEVTVVSDSNHPELKMPVYVTSVEVHRPYYGFMRFTIEKARAESLVGAMLGQTNLLEEFLIQDGLSELVNVIGGRILAQLASASNSFDLSIPTTIYYEKQLINQPLGNVKQVYALDGKYLEIELNISHAA